MRGSGHGEEVLCHDLARQFAMTVRQNIKNRRLLRVIFLGVHNTPLPFLYCARNASAH
jgi:hypothetical protein